MHRFFAAFDPPESKAPAAEEMDRQRMEKRVPGEFQMTLKNQESWALLKLGMRDLIILSICEPSDRWILFALDSAEQGALNGNRVQTVDVSEFSSRDGAVQISAAVFTQRGKEARAKRSDCGFGPGRHRNEAAEPELGMSVRNIY